MGGVMLPVPLVMGSTCRQESARPRCEQSGWFGLWTGQTNPGKSIDGVVVGNGSAQ